jgi:hypothetical protein
LLNETPDDFFKGIQGINQKAGGTLDTSFLANKEGAAIALAFPKTESGSHRRIVVELIESLAEK